MRLKPTFVFAAFLLLCLALPAQESHPNFTGIWKLDTGRSSLNTKAPEAVTHYIHQSDPDFHLRRTEVQHGKSSAWSIHGRTDGKTLEQKSRDGVKRTHMYWQGSQLVLEWQADGKGGEAQKIVRYTLSDGGRTLIAHEAENEWVFSKSG